MPYIAEWMKLLLFAVGGVGGSQNGILSLEKAQIHLAFCSLMRTFKEGTFARQ